MFILIKVIFLAILFLFINEIMKILIGKRIKRDIFKELQSTDNKKKIKNKALIWLIGMVICLLLLGYGVIYSILVPAIMPFLGYGIRNIKINAYKKQVLNDLLNISECLRVQLSSQIPIANALRSLPELCVNKEFSGLLKNLYLEYELSNFIILDSIENLRTKFNYPEIKIFISCLNQQIQGTSTIEALDNLIFILKEKYIEFLEENTKNKMAIMTLGVFGVVLNIAAIGIYPVATEAFNAINVMLK